MHEASKRLYRTEDGRFAGVAGGFARYFGIDPTVMRLIFIALTILTCGLFVVAYIVIWLLIPCKGKPIRPLDVTVDPSLSSCCNTSHAKAAALRGVAVACALVGGVLLLVVALSLAMPFVLPVFSPLQFWPLAVMAFGVLRLAVPGRDGYTLNSIVEGVILLVVGAMALMASLGAVSLRFDGWLSENWAFLCVVAGLLVLARATRSNGFIVAAAVLFLLFCFIGLGGYADRGPSLDDAARVFPMLESVNSWQGGLLQ